MRTRGQSGEARDRLLLAAAELLEGSGDGTLSTRAVCERAGVQAPTLYHHFGSKQGLIDAVINHGFTQYVQPADPTGDPLDDLRHGWDRHVAFGLEHPAFYALLYGRAEPGKPCAVTAPAHAMLRDLLTVAARQGLLTVPVGDAAEQILASNVGVTLSLITQPVGERDMGLSDRVREAALAAVLQPAAGRPAHGGAAVPATRAGAALTLLALVDEDPSGLSAGEHALLRELLDRLAGGGPTPTAVRAGA
ncbi:TetR/AcrR family transcriptional regulator [Nonomuraea sp. NPDC048882]|uniref:TetR/AcrR family transcriptional regulator n=1 Tax=Nonomuraea sp. NPDC048882 TaxID=3154347 RepID=UPI0033BFE8AB